MKFKPVVINKYIGTDGYSLKRSRDGRFSIYLNNRLTDWGCGFLTVRSAENFLNQHNLKHATVNHLPMNYEDIDLAFQMYPLSTDAANQTCPVFVKVIDSLEEGLYVLATERATMQETKLTSADELFLYMDDKFSDEDIFSSVILRGTELRYIFAAKKNRRSSREIVNDLIRVKSSNVWSYGVEVKDNQSKVGDVYVQFKGKNGGPGDVYKVYDVPLSLWRKWISAPSKGHFYNKYLRNNFYYSKLTGDKRGKLPNAIN